jgi:acyl-CoA synthetase (NDP forming)
LKETDGMSSEAFINPKSVAIVGASGNPERTAGRPIRFLKQHGFKGDIWPVNPRQTEIQGLKAYPDLAALPRVPDQIYVTLDTDGAMAACEQAASLGVPFVAVLANGFSELGAEGRAREQRLRDMIRGTRTRILGPNSLGLVRPSVGLILSANAAFAAEKLPQGRISVISQSGATIGTLFSRGRAHGIGYANLVSVGNEADLSVGAVGQLLLDDPETDSFILFMESFKHTHELEVFAEGAAKSGKNVVVYKLGRSEVGAELAVSHTGALVSSDAAADAYLRDLGFHRVDVFEALFEAPALFSKRWTPTNAAKPKVVIVTTTGGGGALVADRLGLNGIEVAHPTAAVRKSIGDAGVEVGGGPLIDLTMAGTNPAVMGAAINAILDEPGYDAAVAVVGSSAEFFPELAVKPIVSAIESRKGPTKPFAVFTVPHATDALLLLSQAGVPAFRTAEACADALTARLRVKTARLFRERGYKPSQSTKDTLGKLGARASEREALDVFGSAGVAVVQNALVPVGREGAIEKTLAGFRFPVVVKVSSPDLPHKSEYGGVKLNVGSAAEVRDAIAQMETAISTGEDRGLSGSGTAQRSAGSHHRHDPGSGHRRDHQRRDGRRVGRALCRCRGAPRASRPR